jgi:quinol monooxygenase YgiN
MTFVLVARWHAKSGQREQIAAILRELADHARQEPGNLAFIVNQLRDDPDQFLLYEQYRDDQAFADHQATPHFKSLVLEQGVPLLASRDRQVYSVLS